MDYDRKIPIAWTTELSVMANILICDDVVGEEVVMRAKDWVW